MSITQSPWRVKNQMVQVGLTQAANQGSIFNSGDLSGAAQQGYGLQVLNTINQTNTASYTDFLINRTQTAAGSGVQLLLDAQVGSVSVFSVSNAGDLTLSGQALTSASTTTRAGLKITPGVAPTSPNNGDVWVTAAGIFARVNGVSDNLAGLNTSPTFTTSVGISPAGVTANSGPILTFGTVTGGSSYTDGTYTNVPLTGGSGIQATATIVVSGGAVSTVNIAWKGSRYVVGDSLSCSNANVGGTGSAFSVPVATVNTVNLYVADTLPNGGGNFRLENTNNAGTTGDPLGSIYFASRDTSTGSAGDLAYIQGTVVTGAGAGASLSFYTSAVASILPSLSLTITPTAVKVPTGNGYQGGPLYWSYDGSSNRVVHNLCHYSAGTTVTGAIVFSMPSLPGTQLFVQLTVKGKQGASAGIKNFIVQGFFTSGAWTQTKVTNLGSVLPLVRLGIDNLGIPCLIIDDVGTSRSAPHYAITEALLQSTNASDSFCSGWTSQLVGAGQTVTTLGAFTGVTSYIVPDTDTAFTIGGAQINQLAGPIPTTGGLGTVVPGSSYTNGTYTNVALTGGSGSYALATVVVAGGAVSTVTITATGTRYVVGDSLSASAATIGGTGSGFSVPVAVVGSVNLYIADSPANGAATIRLENTANLVAGSRLGALFFASQDNSTNASGDAALIEAVTAGISGGGALKFWVSANGAVATPVNSLTLNSDSTITTVSDLTVGGMLNVLATTGLTATGTTQSTALALTAQYNYITTVSLNTGVKLPSVVSGATCVVVNLGANSLNVFPGSSDGIDAIAANSPQTIPPLAWVMYTAADSVTWYSSAQNVRSMNLAAGTTNAIPYQSAAGTTTFLSAGTGLLQAAGGAPSWSLVISGLTSVAATTFSGALSGNATTATTATNVAGGSIGKIVYQTGAGATGFVAVGSTGQVLRSQGAALPVYSTATYPNTGGTALTWMRSDGTNWINSTSTIANTFAINTIAYASGANVLTGLATANNGVLVTSAGGVPSISTTLPAALNIPGALVTVSATVSAAGSTQGTATALTSDVNVITTAAASTGVVLQTAAAGKKVTVVNKGANALAVYPASGGAIDALASNAAISIPVGGWIEFNGSSATQWYSSANNIATAPVAGTNNTTVATTAYAIAAAPNASYRTLVDSSCSHTAASAIGTYAMGQGSPSQVSGTGTLDPPNIIYIDPADYPTVNGLTTQLRVRVNQHCNAVAPTGTYTYGLYPVTRPAMLSGGAGVDIYTLGTVVAGSTVASVSPAAGSSANLVGADFAIPSAGYYVIGFASTVAAVAASAHMHICAILQQRNA